MESDGPKAEFPVGLKKGQSVYIRERELEW